jgi:hypothetical protein
MIIKRNMAVDSLTRVCEESLALIKQLIDADNETYGQGYEDGMAAQAKVQQTLKPWVGLTEDEIKAFDTWHDNREEEVGWCNPSEIVAYIEAKLKEKNT